MPTKPDAIPAVGCTELLGLLRDCYPFLVHAACSIPDDNPEYKQAHALMKRIDPIINARIYEIIKQSSPNTSVSGPCPPSLGSEIKNQLSGG